MSDHSPEGCPRRGDGDDHERPPAGSAPGRDRGSSPRRRSESFTLKLGLGADGDIERTTVVHARSKAEEAWSGWAPERLQAFVGRYCARPSAHAAGSPSARQRQAHRADPLTVELSCGVHPGADRPEDVTIEVGLGSQIAGEPRQISYVADLRAQAIESRRLTRVATASGLIDTTEGLELTLRGVELPRVLHRIYLHLALDLPHDGKAASEVAVLATRWYAPSRPLRAGPAFRGPPQLGS